MSIRLNPLLIDKKFYTSLLSIALPIALQQLIASLLNMVDVLMIGQLGESSIAAVGLSNQLFFLLNLLLFGTTSGMAVFTAQYWGSRDFRNIHKVLSISLLLVLLFSAVFTFVAISFPDRIISLYTTDQEVIDIAAEYLRISAISFMPTAATFAFAAILRSVKQVRMPMLVSIFALSLKTVISYGLIFGKAGLPALGVQGAAIGTVITRVLELSLVIYFVYSLRTPAALHLEELFGYDRHFFFEVLKVSMPATLNEIIWSLGITTYNAVYAHIGTDAIAAININSTFEGLAFVTVLGIGSACAIMVGNEIGSGNRQRAQQISEAYLVLGLVGAIIIGAGYFSITPKLIHMYNISLTAAQYTQRIITIFSLSLWLRVINFILFIGVLRAGGDTRFALLVESLTIWFVGVPSALIGGFVLRLPVYYVYAMVLGEEVVKSLIVFYRFRSKAWIHDLVHQSI